VQDVESVRRDAARVQSLGVDRLNRGLELVTPGTARLCGPREEILGARDRVEVPEPRVLRLQRDEGAVVIAPSSGGCSGLVVPFEDRET
jgi:hypothetical protein